MDLPKRKEYRLKNYDYSQNGAYFITICTKNRQHILWEDTCRGAHCATENDLHCATENMSDNVQDNRNNRNNNEPIYRLSEYGLIIDGAIKNIQKFYSCVSVDKYVIMPNHIHLILAICNDEANLVNGRALHAPTIATIINQMKGYVTKQIGFTIWQKLYYDHIIRNDREYDFIWEYIDGNPLKWQFDCYF